jgi:hypothetical protein
MALHEEAVFVRGDHSETVGCESCHMPYASFSAAVATAAVVGDEGRMGDTRTHIFRIDADQAGFESMFNNDGSEVLTDTEGRAAVTVDFVCLRCHNGIGNVFALTPSGARLIADGIHGTSETAE